jgi:signal peptidase II
VLLVVVVLDVITKAIAVAALYPPGYVTRQVIGDAVRFTLVYNPGAAFGLHLGTHSRWIFMALTLGALIILWRLYRQTLQDDLRKAAAIALVSAGAIGNFIDRVKSEKGVVDFIDIGMEAHRWPTFNIADMAVSVGAFLLAFVLWGEEQALKPAASDASASGTDPIIVKRPDATEIS